MSALCRDELPETDRQPLAKPDPFAQAMALFKSQCPRELSALDQRIDAQLMRGEIGDMT